MWSLSLSFSEWSRQLDLRAAEPGRAEVGRFLFFSVQQQEQNGSDSRLDSQISTFGNKREGIECLSHPSAMTCAPPSLCCWTCVCDHVTNNKQVPTAGLCGEIGGTLPPSTYTRALLSSVFLVCVCVCLSIVVVRDFEEWSFVSFFISPSRSEFDFLTEQFLFSYYYYCAGHKFNCDNKKWKDKALAATLLLLLQLLQFTGQRSKEKVLFWIVNHLLLLLLLLFVYRCGPRGPEMACHNEKTEFDTIP